MNYLSVTEIEKVQELRPGFDTRIISNLREHWNQQIKRIRYEKDKRTKV